MNIAVAWGRSEQGSFQLKRSKVNVIRLQVKMAEHISCECLLRLAHHALAGWLTHVAQLCPLHIRQWHSVSNQIDGRIHVGTRHCDIASLTACVVPICQITFRTRFCKLYSLPENWGFALKISSDQQRFDRVVVSSKLTTFSWVADHACNLQVEF